MRQGKAHGVNYFYYTPEQFGQKVLDGEMTSDQLANALKTAINSWEMGKRYTYRLFYSDDTAKKDRIFFAPSAEGWQDVDVIIVAL